MTAKKKKHGLRKQWPFYVMMAPGLLYLLVNNYGPISGLFIAFKQIDYTKGIFGSPWVGLKYFERFFGSFNFSLLLKNTIGISLYTLLIGFPIPIIFALLLNYLSRT